MKTLFLFALLFFANLSLFSQKEKLIDLEPIISSIVLYTEGVEVSHQLPINLVQGRNLLVFKGLSSKLDPKSIRVNSSMEVSVLSVSNKIDFLTKGIEKPKIKALKDSITILNQRIKNVDDEYNAYLIQKEMLLKNQSISGQSNGISSLELQKTADFFQSRILEIHKKMTFLYSQKLQLEIDLNNHKLELGQLDQKNSFQRCEISVLVQVENAGQQQFDLRYYIEDAGWVPYYEIKAVELNAPLQLFYRAKVFNNTDIDWENIPMVLSTADPMKSANNPQLKPWKLTYYNDNFAANNYQNKEMSNLNDNYNTIQQEQQKNLKQKNGMTYTTISVSELSIDLPIKSKYTVPSDSKPYIIDVTEYQLPATYKHFCVPKLDRETFVIAQIIDWEDLNLVEGQANVYFDNTYVGKSYIYTRDVSDTLFLSLGPDKKVVVNRTKVKEFTSKQFIGSKKKETYRYQMDIKNNRKSPIQIEILDQVPISENSDIEVLVEEISGSDYNIVTGVLTWKYTMEPDTKKQIFNQYTVKYPRYQWVNTRSSTRSKSVRFL